jgi:hypothetical protein
MRSRFWWPWFPALSTIDVFMRLTKSGSAHDEAPQN